MVFHGFPWFSMVFPWFSMVFPWFSMTLALCLTTTFRPFPTSLRTAPRMGGTLGLRREVPGLDHWVKPLKKITEFRHIPHMNMRSLDIIIIYIYIYHVYIISESSPNHIPHTHRVRPFSAHLSALSQLSQFDSWAFSDSS